MRSDATDPPISLRAYFDEKITFTQTLLNTKMDERDRTYITMFSKGETAIQAALAAQEKAVYAAASAAEKAVNAALAAQEKAVAAAAESSAKAIDKAEIAQMGVNERGNEFRKSLDDYTKLMLSRTEADSRFNAQSATIEKQGAMIEELRRGASRGEGGVGAAGAAKTQTLWMLAFVVGSLLTIIGLAIMLVKK